MSGCSTAALAAAVAEAIASGNRMAAAPGRHSAPMHAPILSAAATGDSANRGLPLGLSLPPGLGQDSGFSSSGRFFVIRAAEEQPASDMGHFVRIVSGPHNGYNAAVASLNTGGTEGLQKAGTSHCANFSSTGEGSVKDQISRLLQSSSSNPVLAGFPEQLEAGLRASQMAGGSTMDAQGLQRLLRASQEGAEKRRAPPAEEPEEIVFLPVETPVWHLQSEQKGASAMMVTQAENIEWMRMIWGRLTDPAPIMEAIAKQQHQEDDEKRKADVERTRMQESEQQQQQLSMLNHLMQVLGQGNNQQQLAGLPPGIKQLLDFQPQEIQPTWKSGNSSINSVLSLLGAQQAQKPPLPQSLGIASAIPGATVDKAIIQRELEMAMNRAHGLTSMPSPSLSSQGFLPTSGHNRKGSMDSLSLFDPALLSPRVHQSQAAPIPPSTTCDTKPRHDTPNVRASLTPGTLAPGNGPFYVVAADSRIQLTGTGFYLAVASGPHNGFEDALAAMTCAAHNHTPVRKDAEMVHVLSDTPIWHSLDLMHKPMMIVKAESLLASPGRLEDDSSTAKSPADLLLESLKNNPAALLQQQVLSGAAQQMASRPAAEPTNPWGSHHQPTKTSLPPLSDQLALLGALTSQGAPASSPLDALLASRGTHVARTTPKHSDGTTDMPPPPPHLSTHSSQAAPPTKPTVPLLSLPPRGEAGEGSLRPPAPEAQASGYTTTSAPETSGGLKRAPSRQSLFPNKKAHILGRQQSLSPRRNRDEDGKGEEDASPASDTESGEPLAEVTTEAASEEPVPAAAGDDQPPAERRQKSVASYGSALQAPEADADIDD
mmetsp:Transcript_36178/g.102274  ORF Transcript_36178/g.102274 Transcript_36178/m.102274 type:complete len:826 (-) Transcript_36178:309-2786(-)|eukprot:CAMPEP_0117685872 /NCGR_PEP_ID=MMETSP0804-20121206/22053_1 /TAXON_ID=1074897 /ORGANISM="Tetraselmis astigmatica, Strain CCMP880" /LENGTH=825 /DNA_ID=CAMNT_0005497337 /DNA_START=568 /DNA_END=3045 /DNA_ORIENTATION=-